MPVQVRLGTILKSYSITVVGLIVKYMGYSFESLLRLRMSLRLNRFENPALLPKVNSHK